MPPKTTRIPGTSSGPPGPFAGKGGDRAAGYGVSRWGWLRGMVGAGCLIFLIRLWAAPVPEPKVLAGEAALLARMASQGTNVASLYELGDFCHSAGGRGDKAAVVRAETYLRRLLVLESNHAPALALLGSVYTMKGRDAFWPTTQLRLVKEGNDFMDKAIQLEPENHRVRLTRAFNNAHMPDFLGRTQVVRADLAWLWEKAEKEPARFTVAERQETALHWGRQWKRQGRTGEARTVWEKGRLLDVRSDLARQLADELAKLP